MKNTLRTLFTLACLCVIDPGMAAEDGVTMPYNSVNRSMAILKSQKVNGVECVPWYIRYGKKGELLDVEKARFRVRTWEGKEHMLDIELLSKTPEAEMTDLEKELVAQGYTHRLWIPKGKEEFMDGDLVHSLPQGSIEMSQGLMIAGGKGKAPKK